MFSIFAYVILLLFEKHWIHTCKSIILISKHNNLATTSMLCHYFNENAFIVATTDFHCFYFELQQCLKHFEGTNAYSFSICIYVCMAKYVHSSSSASPVCCKQIFWIWIPVIFTWSCAHLCNFEILNDCRLLSCNSLLAPRSNMACKSAIFYRCFAMIYCCIFVIFWLIEHLLAFVWGIFEFKRE